MDQTDPGWYAPESLDADRLDLGDPRDCVCGQRFGGFAEAIDRFAIDDPDTWSERHGFTAGSEAEYAALRLAWLAEIAERRGESEEPPPPYAVMNAAAIESLP